MIIGRGFYASLFFMYHKAIGGEILSFVKNEIRAVRGNTISFSVYHETNGKQYKLNSDEKYKIKIKKSLRDANDPVYEFVSDSESFDFDCQELTCGEYYFQIDFVNSFGDEETISPAVDEHGNRLNTLIILERL